MTLKNTFITATKAITVNGVRSFLTMLGVIIGVASVVMLISIGKGLEHYITGQFEELGANNIIISPGDPFSDSGGFSPENLIGSKRLKLKDAKNISKLREYLKYVVPIAQKEESISFQQETRYTTVIGTSYEYPLARNTKIAKGEFFSKADQQGGEKVAVLGGDIAEELFGQADPIGKKIKISKQNYRVIGVAEKIGASFGGPPFDKYVYIPLENSFKLFESENLRQIIATAKNKDMIDETINQIEILMLKDFKEDEFSAFDQTEILSAINNILSMLTIGLGGIAAISLLVGGIGIMNIMLVSVTERTREIGLRKALGATPQQILLQFLIEASLLSVMGGLIGLGIAFGGSLLIQIYFPAKVTLDAILLSFIVSTVVGLIFGVTPARRASKLSPIEALRYE